MDNLVEEGSKSNSGIRIAILFAVLCTVFTSLGQILWKFGLVKINFSHLLTVFNLPFMFGFVVYGIGAILLLLALGKGELSLIYPIIAASYVWVSLLSPYLFPTDHMNVWKWVGVIIILVSVSLLGWGNSRINNKPKPEVVSV